MPRAPHEFRTANIRHWGRDRAGPGVVREQAQAHAAHGRAALGVGCLGAGSHQRFPRGQAGSSGGGGTGGGGAVRPGTGQRAVREMAGPDAADARAGLSVLRLGSGSCAARYAFETSGQVVQTAVPARAFLTVARGGAEMGAPRQRIESFVVRGEHGETWWGASTSLNFSFKFFGRS